MRTEYKLAIGAVSLVPLACDAAYLAYFASVFASVVRGGMSTALTPSFGTLVPPAFLWLFLLLSAMLLWRIVLLGCYLWHLFSNVRVEGVQKVLWAIVLFLGSDLAMPIYWYAYLWRDQPSAVSSIPSPTV